MPARAQTTQWIEQFGTGGDDDAWGVAADASGVYVVGQTPGGLPGLSSSGGDDAFIRKYDTEGTEVWTRQFGTNRNDAATGVAVDASGIYVVGRTIGVLPGQFASGGGDAFVRKYDASGREVWTRQFGSIRPDQANGVAVDDSGVYVVGWTSGALPGQTGTGGDDAFIRKYDTNGNEQWTRQFGSADRDEPFGVAVDASGIYVAGATLGTLPGQTASGFSSTDAFVRKYDVDGVAQWTRQFGSAGSDDANGVAVDATGVYVGGRTSGELPGQSTAGNADAFVRKYDAGGAELWTRQFGTGSADQANALAADGGGVYIVGRTLGLLAGQLNEGEEDLFARKYNSSGSVQWSSQEGSEETDSANAVAVYNSGVYVAGTTEDKLAAERSAGARDAFLLQLRTNTPCSYSIAPTNESFPVSGGTGSVEITGSRNCGWTAVSNTSWIEITSDSSGTFRGVVDYTVAANSGAASRTGTLSAAGLRFTITQAGTASLNPAVDEGGVVNNASYSLASSSVAPGMIAAIFGRDLTDGSSCVPPSCTPSFEAGRLQTTLAGATVTVNGTPAPMFYATPLQLGLQIPYELSGDSASIVVTVGGRSSTPRPVPLEPLSPGIFAFSQDGQGAGAVTHADGTSVSEQNPAQPSEVVILYATGLGQVTPLVPTGALPTDLTETVTQPAVTVDGVAAEVLFSGLSGCCVGLNQVNLRIPSSTRTASDIPVVVSIGGRESNPVTIAVGP